MTLRTGLPGPQSATGCSVTRGKSLDLSVLPFPHLHTGNNQFPWAVVGVNDLMYEKFLDQSLTRSPCSNMSAIISSKGRLPDAGVIIIHVRRLLQAARSHIVHVMCFPDTRNGTDLLHFEHLPSPASIVPANTDPVFQPFGFKIVVNKQTKNPSEKKKD